MYRICLTPKSEPNLNLRIWWFLLLLSDAKLHCKNTLNCLEGVLSRNMTGFCESPLSITPSNKPCGNHFAKDQKITSIQTMRPAPGDSVGSEHASQNCPSGKSVRLAMMAWIRGHLGYNGSCLSKVASNQHTNTQVFLLLKLLSIRRSFPVLVLKAHVFCRPTHFPVKKSHPINACHPDSTFYPRAASAYPESWMVWDGACPIPFHAHWLSGASYSWTTMIYKAVQLFNDVDPSGSGTAGIGCGAYSAWSRTQRRQPSKHETSFLPQAASWQWRRWTDQKNPLTRRPVQMHDNQSSPMGFMSCTGSRRWRCQIREPMWRPANSNAPA